MDATMKILSSLNAVFSLIGSSVMAPAYVEARYFGGNAPVSTHDTPSGAAVGGGVGGAPFIDPSLEPLPYNSVTSATAEPTEQWIEALKVLATRPPDQVQYAAVVGMPRNSHERLGNIKSRPSLSRFRILPLTGLGGLPKQPMASGPGDIH